MALDPEVIKPQHGMFLFQEDLVGGIIHHLVQLASVQAWLARETQRDDAQAS